MYVENPTSCEFVRIYSFDKVVLLKIHIESMVCIFYNGITK